MKQQRRNEGKAGQGQRGQTGLEAQHQCQPSADLQGNHQGGNNKIDIYVGEDRGAALAFGERKVRIWWVADD